jgi:starch synthase
MSGWSPAATVTASGPAASPAWAGRQGNFHASLSPPPAASGAMPGPRILIVTPEITYLPSGMGNMAERMSAKAGGLADVSASLVSALYDLGADIHVALPNYRRMFNMDVFNLHDKELRKYSSKLSQDRIHLAEDRLFYYREEVYSGYQDDAMRVALTFQREVINNIIPAVRPDLIHCNDWMTGLIPSYARRLGIPTLFTVHNIHTQRASLAEIEDRGIDAAQFWTNLYFDNSPASYEAARDHNKVDLLTSGIFASHYINTVSPRFLWEITQGWHNVVPDSVRRELSSKVYAGCARGILNAPDPSYDPRTDDMLAMNYGPENAAEGKAVNKRALQEALHLEVNENAPLLLWPSRLDPVQKGPQLLSDILYHLIDDYRERPLQLAVVANGPHQRHFHEIVKRHDLTGRVSIVDFDEKLSRLGYAAADFMIMPSLFEPCGLPQMISPLYGTLPIVHATGGLWDTIHPLEPDANRGNGFRFEIYGTEGLRWSIDQAMKFHALPAQVRQHQIERIMRESINEFSHETCARHYFDIYESMLKRPLVGLEHGPGKATA